MCEDFESISSFIDCGYYTPDGYVDQWASSAVGNPDNQDRQCPENTIVGPPSQYQASHLFMVITL